MTPEEFTDTVANLAFDNAFNPYRDRCHLHDHHDAPLRRLELLRTILAAASDREVEAIWVGRDFGRRGGRRTGLAFTDDPHVAAHAARWGVRANGFTVKIEAERTASMVWAVLGGIEKPIFLWNVFPLHPHEPGNPFSNRRHNKCERQAGEELLSELVSMLKPLRLIAVGADAQDSCRRVAASLPVVDCRHPSYGGEAVFRGQINGAYA